MTSKLGKLIKDKQKIIERIGRVKERLREEKDNEEAWPGHDSTSYLDELNNLSVLESHLENIEKAIAVLHRK